MSVRRWRESVALMLDGKDVQDGSGQPSNFYIYDFTIFKQSPVVVTLFV